MAYKSAVKGQHVITYGDVGKIFYVIISGSCDIYIPVKKTIKLTDLELLKLQLYRSDFLISVDDQSKKGEKVEIDHAQVADIKKQFESIDLDEILATAFIEYDRSLIKYPIDKEVNIDSFITIGRRTKHYGNTIKIERDIYMLIKMKEMVEGEHFGDIALTQEKARTATVVASEDSSFAILNK